MGTGESNSRLSLPGRTQAPPAEALIVDSRWRARTTNLPTRRLYLDNDDAVARGLRRAVCWERQKKRPPGIRRVPGLTEKKDSM